MKSIIKNLEFLADLFIQVFCFVTFSEKFLQKLGVFGRLLTQVLWHIFFEDCLPLFRPRGLERSSFLDKVMAFSRLTFA